MKPPIYIWMCLALLAACRLEGLPDGQPSEQGHYFLWQTDSSHHLAIWQMGVLRPQLEESWLEPNETLISMEGAGDQIWLITQNPAQVRSLDLPSEALASPLPDFPLSAPSGLAKGPEHLLVLDSLNGRMAIWLEERSSWVELRPASAPGKALYRAGHFYVSTAAPAVEVWNARALARVAEIPLQRPVIRLQRDGRNRIWVFTRSADSLFQAGIEINSQTLLQAESPPPFSDQWYSPYIRQQFGTEYTQPVILQNGVVRPGNLVETTDFQPDFFGAFVYFTRDDSLFRVRIRDNEISTLGPLSGSLRRAYHWWDF